MKDFLISLILEAGGICIQKSEKIGLSDLKFKNKKDLVTTADRYVEDVIITRIKQEFPLHDILGEETGRTNNSSDYLWIIDPIDGTTSFFHKQPFYSVSIAVQQKGETILGAVYAPVLNELFLAEKGKGAFQNNTRVQVSKTDVMINSVMATGFACIRADLEPNNLGFFNRIIPKIRDIRRYGSAAIDLCYVACGKLDGFWEMNLNIYDIAAGALMVTEAGGHVFDFNGNNNFPEQGIIATNGILDKELSTNFNKDLF
ncbi:MAG: inositol monophosphatase [Desulfobacteraceae bacterium]|nr:inositol monophosphatase [Desulfobacteraceae bacterium]